jgi:hypothetical protein
MSVTCHAGAIIAGGSSCTLEIKGASPGGALKACPTNGSASGVCADPWLTADSNGYVTYTWPSSCAHGGLPSPCTITGIITDKASGKTTTWAAAMTW